MSYEVASFRQAQQVIASFVERNQLEMPLEARILDVVCELGELTKVILSATNYGSRPLVASERLDEEFGDVLFSLICVASLTGTDLESALRSALIKYAARIRDSGSPSSGK